MRKKLLLGSVFAAITMAVLLPGTFAAAQDQPDPYIAPSPVALPTDVDSKEITFPDAASNGSTGSAGSETAASSLAFTGGDVVGLAAIGLSAIGIGFATMAVRTRHRGTDATT